MIVISFLDLEVYVLRITSLCIITVSYKDSQKVENGSTFSSIHQPFWRTTGNHFVEKQKKELNAPNEAQLNANQEVNGNRDFYKTIEVGDVKEVDWRRKLGGMLMKEIGDKEHLGKQIKSINLGYQDTDLLRAKVHSSKNSNQVLRTRHPPPSIFWVMFIISARRFIRRGSNFRTTSISPHIFVKTWSTATAPR